MIIVKYSYEINFIACKVSIKKNDKTPMQNSLKLIFPLFLQISSKTMLQLCQERIRRPQEKVLRAKQLVSLIIVCKKIKSARKMHILDTWA